MDEKPSKTLFWINEVKIYSKSEDLGIVNYIGLHVCTLALGLLLP